MRLGHDLVVGDTKRTNPDMNRINTKRERFIAKRRKTAIERALRYLNEGLEGLEHFRKGTSEQRVRDSSRPMTTAKLLIKDWYRRRRRAS